MGKNKLPESSWAVILSTDLKRILLLKRSETSNNPLQWCLPGGSSKKKSAKRLIIEEVKQEIGYKSKRNDFFKLTTIHRPNKIFNYYLMIGDISPKFNDGEHISHKWKKLENLKNQKDLHQSVILLLKYLKLNNIKSLKKTHR